MKINEWLIFRDKKSDLLINIKSGYRICMNCKIKIYDIVVLLLKINLCYYVSILCLEYD